MSQRLLEILVDSFWKILLPGFTITIPLTVISFALAMVIATVTALIQFGKVQILTPLARFTSGSSGVRRCWCSCM